MQVTENAENGTVVTGIVVADEDDMDQHTCYIQNKRYTPFQVMSLNAPKAWCKGEIIQTVYVESLQVYPYDA